MKNKVRGKVKKNEAEDTTQHRAVRSDRRVRERHGTIKVEKKRGNLRNRRVRHRVSMTMTPGTEDGPLRLVIHSSGSPLAAGKLTSHRQSESESLADHSRYERQSAEARGGSGESDGCAAV